MTHDERCLAAVASHARGLAKAVAEGRLNRSSLWNLLTGYVDQPAYDMTRRSDYVDHGMSVADQVLASEASV